MSPSSARDLRLGVLLFAAVCLQSAFADALRMRGTTPDLPLVAAIIASMRCDANRAAVLGFAIGLFHAALAAPVAGGYTALIVSRLCVCFGVGWLEERIFRDSLALAIGLVALGSLLSEVLFFVIAPQANIPQWFRQTVYETLYNTLLAAPAYIIIRKFIATARYMEDATPY